MVKVGIKELKDNLSKYLNSVKSGENIIIYDRTKPIAEIKKIAFKENDMNSTIENLKLQGKLISQNKKQKIDLKNSKIQIKLKNKTIELSKMIYKKEREK
ncbi:MAG: type II toxin-antitoxin system Phd/YefM family antitoxin [Spirochaetia bacterium]|nr:type II toxin-antitoxin system Phd/YefM family antitoxin [Spirochaetia bacterium]